MRISSLIAAVASVSFLMFSSGCGPEDPPPPPANNAYKVLVPNGGETYAVGDSMTITWDEPSTVSGTMVEISVDDGMNWLLLTTASRIQPGVKTFKFKITPTLPDDKNGGVVPVQSTSCRVHVFAYGDDANVDQSDAVFTIN